MNRLLASSAVFVLAGLLLSATAAGSGPETRDAELAATIELYRTEGAEVALPEFERLQAGFRATGNPTDEAHALRYIGEAHWRLGNLEQSRDFLDQALPLMRTTGQRYGEGKTLNVLGLLEWDLGNYEAALTAMGEANAIAAELDHQLLEASTLNNMGLVHDEMGDYQASLAAYQRSHELFKAAGHLGGQGDALGNTGGVYLLLGRFGEALDYYRQALAISEEIASKPAMTIDHGNIALCLLGLGQYQDALEHFEQALALARETGMRQEEAYWQRGMASAQIRQGKYDLGLENHRAALAAYEETGARGLLLDALHDMGRLYLELGDLASAESHFQRAMTMARDMGHQQAVTANLLALGDLQLHQDATEEAKALYLQAFQRATQAGEQSYRVEALLKLAEAKRLESRFEEAEEHARAALDTARHNGVSAGEAQAWFAMAEAERGQARRSVALNSYASALASAGPDADPDLLWQIHFGRAMVHVQKGDKVAAIGELQAAVRIIEGIRDRLKEDRFRAGYLQDKYQIYIELVRLQLEAGLTEDAFSTAERLRARSFLAQLERGAPVARTESDRRVESELRERIRQLQELLIEEQRREADNRRQMALNAFSLELMQAERDYQSFLDDLRGRTPALRAMDVPELGDVRTSLGDGEVLIEYVLSDGEIMIFVVSSEGLTATTQPIDATQLEARISLVRGMIQQPGNERWIKPAASLATSLLAPLVEQHMLDGARHLYLVPHGVLNYLPFALLPVDDSGKEVLIERYSLSYLPAAAALVHSNGRASPGRSLLAMAPATARLKYAPEEARSVVALYQPDSRLLAGEQATESAFKAQASAYDVLHLATHGYFNRRNPLLSGLELEADTGNDGLLEVHEILALDLHAQLVTLSACQTGLGSGWFNEIPAGDDFVGLTRAFLFAGSHAVLASLWEVDDRSTVDLMQGFYRRLESESGNRDQAYALAQVQREMRASKEFNHPFYWAPFVLVGQHTQGAAQS